jgi:hypothetical protein
MALGRTFCELLAFFIVLERFSIVLVDGKGVDILGIGVGKHGGLDPKILKLFSKCCQSIDIVTS